MDGCLANFNKAYARLLSEQAERLPSTWTEDFESQVVPKWINTWDWDKMHGFTSDERNEVWNTIKSTDFWFELEPLPGALDAIERLETLAEDNEIYFLTTRPGKQAKQQTEDWLFSHGMTTPTVLITGLDKNPVIEGLELEFLVDDKPINVHNAAAIRECRVHLVDAPYNRVVDHPLVRRVASVSEALEAHCPTPATN